MPSSSPDFPTILTSSSTYSLGKVKISTLIHKADSKWSCFSSCSVLCYPLPLPSKNTSDTNTSLVPVSCFSLCNPGSLQKLWVRSTTSTTFPICSQCPSHHQWTEGRKSVVPIHIMLIQPWGPTKKSITVAKLLKLSSAFVVLLLNRSSHLLVLSGVNNPTQPDSFYYWCKNLFFCKAVCVQSLPVSPYSCNSQYRS